MTFCVTNLANHNFFLLLALSVSPPYFQGGILTRAGSTMALEAKLDALETAIENGTWVPLTTTGKQLSPNTLRGHIQTFLAEKSITQTIFRRRAGGLNLSTFHRFMTGLFRNQWSACSNQTYLCAAQFLAVEKIRQQILVRDQKKQEKKRKRDEMMPIEKLLMEKSTPTTAPLSSKKQKKEQVALLLTHITSVRGVELDGPIYDNCDIVRTKTNRFLNDSGIGIGALLRAVGNINGGSWVAFKKFKGKGAGAANVCYPVMYKFFEQKRLLEKISKSKARVEAERNFGSRGYSRRHAQDNKSYAFRAKEISKKEASKNAAELMLQKFGVGLNERDVAAASTASEDVHKHIDYATVSSCRTVPLAQLAKLPIIGVMKKSEEAASSFSSSSYASYPSYPSSSSYSPSSSSSSLSSLARLSSSSSSSTATPSPPRPAR